MKNQAFTPIGYNFAFSGNFNGNKYTIKNLNISSLQNSNKNLGIFGDIINATIKNVSVFGGEVYLSSNRYYAGGVVGYAYNSTIEGCYNLGTKIYTATNNKIYIIGGVVGYANALSTSSSIKHCFNMAEIYSNSTNRSIAGGIVGYTNGTVKECFNMGTVKAGTSSSSISYAGGITGQSGTISDCYNKGTITATAETIRIVDNSNHNVTNSYSPLYSSYGYAYGNRTNTYGLDERIYNIYTDDTVDGKYGYSMLAYAGGISGMNSSTITDCYNYGDISGGYSDVKYTIEYIIGGIDRDSNTHLLMHGFDHYTIKIDEKVRFANPIAYGDNTLTNCYAKNNCDAQKNPIYYCNYKIDYEIIEMYDRNATSDSIMYNYIDAVVKDKYTLVNNGRDSYGYDIEYTSHRANSTSSVSTLFYSWCNGKYINKENLRRYGMNNCKVQILNRYVNRFDEDNSNEDRIIVNFNYLRARFDQYSKVYLGNLTQDYDGNKLQIVFDNNFVQVPNSAETFDGKSLPSSFDTKLWGINKDINDGNPYLKYFFWQEYEKPLN